MVSAPGNRLRQIVAVPRRSALASSMRSGLTTAVRHQSLLVPIVIRPLSAVPSVTGRSTLTSPLWERTAHDVRMGIRAGVEERKTHEEGQDDRAHNGEWHMMEKEATVLIAGGTERVNRRLGRWLHVTS